MILREELCGTGYKNIYDANNRLYKLSNGKYLYVGVYEYVEDEGLDERDEEVLDADELMDGDVIDWYYCLFDGTGACVKTERLRRYDNFRSIDSEDAAEYAIADIFVDSDDITYELAANVEYRNCYPAKITIK